MPAMKLVFIHTLNNFSGSPKVLSVVVGELSQHYECTLITSRGEGFLSGIGNVRYVNNHYRWSGGKVATMLRLVWSQIFVFFMVLFWKGRGTLFYINTITPFGAALACKLTGKKRIYHVHENMRQRKPLYSVYRRVFALCNTKTIFVSKYLESTACGLKDSRVIYNCLDDDFTDRSAAWMSSPGRLPGTNILFVGSLRRFKGVDEFVAVARMLPEYRFEMVLSAAESEIAGYFGETVMPENLAVYPWQTDLHPFYRRAKLLLQLSHPDECVEAFGLTILEAMAYGVPAIVPDAGGPLELVENGVNGFTVDPYDVECVRDKILAFMNDNVFYAEASRSAFEKSMDFTRHEMTDNVERYISDNEQTD
jgi:glycosyltransferase involved in cell wall biosynthesis